MNAKNIKITTIIFSVALILSLISFLVMGIVMEPTVTERDFEFSVTYVLNGETKTLEGVYRSEYHGHGEGEDPKYRYYDGYFLSDDPEGSSGAFLIDQKGDLDLCIVLIFSDYYLMGDAEYDDYNEDPYLAVYDVEGAEYDDEEHLGNFDAEIVSWEYPQPVDNSFVFAGFSRLHLSSALVLTLIGILAIVACIIFVRRDKEVPYKTIDILSIVMNVLIFFMALPFIVIVVAFIQLVINTDGIVYQIFLCIPPITTFSIAASVALRRMKCALSGLLVQFIGPMIFMFFLLLDIVL